MAERNGASRLYLYLSIAGALAAFLAPIIFGSYWVSNLESRVQTLERAAPQAERLAGDVRVLQNQQVANCQQFAKIETQFGITETVINQSHVNDVRTLSMFWQKDFGTQPAQIYYEIKIPHDLIPCD